MASAARLERWVRLCRYIKRIIFFTCHYPAFSQEFIESKIAQPQTDPNELADYQANRLRSGLWRSGLLAAFYTGYCLKYLYFILASFSLFNYADPDSNVKEAPFSHNQLEALNYSASLSSNTFKSIACLVTNCSRLNKTTDDSRPPVSEHRATKLAQDAGQLPLFDLCHMSFHRLFFAPSTKSGSFGVLVFLTAGYTVFLLGTWTTSQQMISHASNDMIMFITSPKITSQLVRQRASEILADLMGSYRNHHFSSLGQDTTRSLHDRLDSTTTTTTTTSSITQSGSSSRAVNSCRKQSLTSVSLKGPAAAVGRTCFDYQLTASSNSSSDRNINLRDRKGLNSPRASTCSGTVGGHCELNHCMPLVRAPGWWRAELAHLMIQTQTLSILVITAMSNFMIVYLGHRASLERWDLEALTRQMNESKCNLWHLDAAALDQQHAVRFDQLHYNWSLYTWLEALLTNYITAYAIAFLFGYFWCMITEIAIWLAELRRYLLASVLVARIDHERILANGLWPNELASGWTNNVRRIYTIPSLRAQFEQFTQLTYMLFFSRIKRSRELDRPVRDQSVFSLQIISSKRTDYQYIEYLEGQIQGQPIVASGTGGGAAAGDQSTMGYKRGTMYDIATMEQIYVNFRLLVEYIDSLGRSMTVVVAITYLLNYGYVLIAVLFRSRFSGFTAEPLIIIIFGNAIANILIFLCADFHANAKKLQPLLWSLVANMTYAEGTREQHMRALWLRQVVQLETVGGLALNTLGLRITYVYIIQLLIWTATILALALKQRD